MKDLLRKLIRADTTVEKGELAAADIIRKELKQAGIVVRIDKWNHNRANIIATVKSAGRKRSLMFACHLDVVPPGQAKWKYSPFAAVEKDGRIYGRGSADMKAGIAAVVTAIREVVDSGVSLKGDIILFAAAGEETDSCGAKRFINRLNEAKPQKLIGVIVPEPTNFAVVTSHRGLLWLEIATKGKAAHGSAPQSGINAISSTRLLLNELANYSIRCKPHKSLGECSMSINTIKAGKAINIIPDKCTIGIDIRTLPYQSNEDIINGLQKIVSKLNRRNPEFDAEISVVRNSSALETDSDCDFVRDFCVSVGKHRTSAVGFATDGPYFARLNAPVVIFGPGNPQSAHKPDEYVEIADVKKAVSYYKKIILRFLSDL